MLWCCNCSKREPSWHSKNNETLQTAWCCMFVHRNVVMHILLCLLCICTNFPSQRVSWYHCRRCHSLCTSLGYRETLCWFTSVVRLCQVMHAASSMTLIYYVISSLKYLSPPATVLEACVPQKKSSVFRFLREDWTADGIFRVQAWTNSSYSESSMFVYTPYQIIFLQWSFSLSSSSEQMMVGMVGCGLPCFFTKGVTFFFCLLVNSFKTFCFVSSQIASRFVAWVGRSTIQWI